MIYIKHLFLPLILILLSACSEKTENVEPSTTKETPKIEKMKPDNTKTPLKDELEARKANFNNKASEEKKKLYGEGIQDVVDNKIVENALQVGDMAPDFTLKNATGESVSLYKKLEDGPVILMWYRGGWCPYCNLTLHEMQENLPEFNKYNASLLALTPELPDSSISTKEKNELEFEVLSDIDNKVAHDYKIVFTLIDGVASAYEKGFGLSKYNGNTSAELPLAATYIIGKDKTIKYAFLDEDYRNRAEPNDLVTFLKNM